MSPSIRTCRDPFTRRQFAQALALLAVSPLAAHAGGEQAEPDPQAAASDVLSEIVRSRFGKYLTKEQMAEVKKAIAHNQRLAQSLKKVKLQNSDEPAFSFHADPA